MKITVIKQCSYCGLFKECEGKYRKTNPWYCSAECYRKAKDELNEKLNEKKPTFKGKKGYVYEYVKKYGKHILQHRWVMEKHIGRKLYPYEVVHHINGIKHDNRIENLELLPEKGKHNTRVQEVYLENQRLKEKIKKLELANA